MEKLSFVIPCYCSENSIVAVVNGIHEVMRDHTDYTYEIILTNDGSKDGTWNALRKLSQERDNVIAINLSRNFGQHSALLAAYRNVSGDYIVGLDDDGEYDPHDAFKLIDELKEKGYDYVCAQYKKKKESAFRNMGSKINNWMTSVMIDKPKDIELSSFYVERRFVTDSIARATSPFPYIAGLLLQATHNIGTVEMSRHDRMFGASGYNLRKLLKLWINGLLGFSVKPLRAASVIGIASSILGFAYAIFTVVKKIMNPQIAMGYSSLLASILVVGGIIMILLGIIGEYLGRLYILSSNAPQYVIREVYDGKEKK